MRREKSCGALVLCREGGEWKMLLTQNRNGGHWAFPKGHVEAGETEKETAIREVLEETGVSIVINTDFRTETQYSPASGVIKDVVYFLCVVSSMETVRQEEEIDAICWMTLSQAEKRVTFERDKEIVREAKDYAEKYLK